MPKVSFNESRIFTRAGKIHKFWAGEVYDFDPIMQSAIDLGHAEVAPEEVAATAAPETPAVAPDTKAMKMRDPGPAKRSPGRNGGMQED